MDNHQKPEKEKNPPQISLADMLKHIERLEKEVLSLEERVKRLQKIIDKLD